MLERERRPAFNSLRIEALSLAVQLGCTSQERANPQEIRLSVEIRFRELPKGALTDFLSDTVCFAKVSQAIRMHCETREFQLLERMAYEVHDLVRELGGAGIEVAVSVHKVRPPVENLHGGTFFRCGDFPL